jgi:hypothetical protein
MKPILILALGLPLWAQQQLALTELRPNQAPVNTSVNLTAIGAGFSPGFIGSAANIPGSILIWRRNGVETALATTYVNSNTLTTVIPANLMVNAPGTADILVQTGNARSNPLTFTITSPLQLTSLNPNRAPTRAANGAPQDLQLIGQAFANNAQVLWQAAAGSAFTELEVISRAGNTQIQTRIPAALLTLTSIANVFVRNPGNSDIAAVSSNALPFTIFQALRLDRVDPPSLPAGSPNSRITAFGQGFTASTRIGFRDAGGTRIPTVQNVNVQAGSIDVTVGADLLTAPKTWQLVATDAGFTSDPINFAVTAPGVALTSISPNTRPAASGQFDLILNGTGFTDDAVVLFGATVLTPASRSATQLRVNVTAPAAAGDVTIAVRAAGVTSNSQILTFTAPAPVITALSPPSRPVNSGDFDLTITGRNFTPNPTVTFGGQGVTISGTPTAASVTVRIPAARIQQAGNVAVIVRVNNVDSESFNFQVTAAAPVITSIAPASRPANSGDFDLTISGQNLAPNPTVTFGGQAAGITGTPTATSITVRIPNARIAQPGNLAVVVRANNTDSNSVNFQVTVAGPTISSLSPASRPAGSGDFTLTINGQNFTPNPAVTFGGQPVQATTGTATSIQVQIPNARILQPGPVVVRVQVGDLNVTANFTVAAPDIPAVTVSSPVVDVQPNGNTTTTIALAGAAPVTVTGTLELSFAPNAANLPQTGYADPALVFVSGGQKRVTFTIPAGQTQAQIPGNGAFNVGTVAGTVTIRVIALSAAGVDATSLPPPRTVTIPRAGPSITPGSARLSSSAGQVTVEVQGFAPTREMTQAAVTFTIASGVTVSGSTTFTVPLETSFTTWFGSDAGRNNGSRFLLQIPFTVPEGDPNQITGFSITLTSPGGSPATATGVR